MSTLTKDQITKIAKLARIRIDESEQDYYAGEVAGIIAWVEKLSEVNTDNIEPLFAANQDLKMFNDAVKNDNLCEEVLGNSPERQFDFYTVPKVVEE